MLHQPLKSRPGYFITAKGIKRRLITLRSNDQFNTTVYGLDDRLSGINGTRMVVLMNEADIEEHGLKDGDEIDLLERRPCAVASKKRKWGKSA
jgi:anaerobic selenocysteine-containing dehydrogenase